MKNRFFKTLTSLVLVVLMVAALVPAALIGVMAAEENTKTYTFSEYVAGTQYAEGEEHELDDKLTVTTTQAHFTSELRLYSSSEHDGYAIFESTKPVEAMVLNAGNKADTLNVYTSTDGTTWTLAEGVATTSAYADHTVSFDPATKYIKLDVAGTQQVRIKYVTMTYAEETSGGDGGDEVTPPACEHTNKVAIGEPKDATCNEPGMTAGEKCADCQEVLTPQAEIPATGEHNYVEGACSVCGEADPNAAPSTPANVFEKFTGKLVEGDYLFVYGTYAMNASVSSGRLTNGTFKTENPDAAIIWHIAPVAGVENTYTIYNASVNAYAAGTGAKNKAQLLDDGTDTKAQWTVTVNTDGTYDFVNVANEAAGVNKTLRNNKSYGWACYAPGTGGALTLYKLKDAPDADCPHTNSTEVAEQPATCTEKGYTAGKYCNDCNAYVSGHEEIPMVDHDYNAETNLCGSCGVLDPKNATPAQKIDFAYNLKSNEKTKFEYSLTGTITDINTVWNGSRITFTISIEGVEKTMYCYGVEGDATVMATVEKGGTITVTGYFKNYNGTIEFDGGCKASNYQAPAAHDCAYDAETGVCSTCGNLNPYATPAQIVAYAFGLKSGVAMNGTWTLTGVVTEIESVYSSEITLNILVEGKVMKCYRLAGTDIAKIKVGDTITVTGPIKNYNGTIEFDSGCTMKAYVDNTKATNYSLSLNGAISVNLYVTVATEWLAANPGAKVVFKNGTTVLLALDAVAGTDTKYTCDLAPNMLNTTITCELTTDGNTVVVTKNVSIANYINYWMGLETAPAGMTEDQLLNLKLVLGALQDYCIAANDYIDGTSNLGTQTAPDTIVSAEMSNANGMNANAIQFTTISAHLHSTVTLRIFYTLAEGKAVEDYTFSVWNGNGVKVAEGVSLAEYSVDGHLNITGISYENLADVYSVTITDGTNENTIKVSVNYYIQEALKTVGDNTQLKNLLITMYTLYKAADLYTDSTAA